MSFSLTGLGRQEMQNRQKIGHTVSGKTGMSCVSGYRSRNLSIRSMPRLPPFCKRNRKTWSRCSTVARGTMTLICCSPTWLTIYSTKRRTSRVPRKARQSMSKPRVCIKCGGKESEAIPFYSYQGNICSVCRSEYGTKRYADKKKENEKQEEIVSQPVSSECVKLPSTNPPAR